MKYKRKYEKYIKYKIIFKIILKKIYIYNDMETDQIIEKTPKLIHKKESNEVQTIFCLDLT